MRVFLRCVVEAIAENGLKGLAAMVPGGPYACAIAEGTWRKYRERCALVAQQQEMRELAQATLEDARAKVVSIARDVLAAVPVGPDIPIPEPAEIVDLELFVASVPDAVRQSLKRPDDATGRSVPAGFALRSADDVLRLLPARPPRFRPGDDLPGRMGWVLERLLGTGGFGEVWLARNTEMPDDFDDSVGAVKICYGATGRELIHESELITRVMRAGKHPNIVPLKDRVLKGETPWIMFEYVGGGTLTDWIHQLAGRPPAQRLPQVLSALRQLCDAVAFFHALPTPVVHRDLKPSNILLDRKAKKLRITDFGIGSITATETNRQESRGQSTRGGRLLSYLRGSCTPLYSSPQQRRGAHPDPRDDVHALGVIAYQMLTGKLDAAPGPRAGKAIKEVVVDEALAELLLNCVSEHVEDRPADAGELLAQLSAAKQQEEPRRKSVERQHEVDPTDDPFHLAHDPKPGETHQLPLPDGSLMMFAWIPPGTFQMHGNDSRLDTQRRIVIRDGFWMGTTPITQSQWQSVMGNSPSYFKGDDRPVESVTWKECHEFCDRLVALTGRPFRLPTEDEWEYACRAGSAGDYCNGDGEESLTKVGWFNGNSGAQTHPVGKLSPNAWGLYDVHGNVWEWCQDAYLDPSSNNESRPKRTKNYHVLRGGSWMGGNSSCTASARST